MKEASKVSNVHGQFHFKQKQRLTIVFTGNTLSHWRYCIYWKYTSRKGAEDSIVDKLACHQRATLPKLNSLTTPQGNNIQ